MPPACAQPEQHARALQKSKQINPQFYGLRWLSLLLSQEFDLPDLVPPARPGAPCHVAVAQMLSVAFCAQLRLWDSLFAVEDPTQFLLQFCCVMLMCALLASAPRPC